MHNHAEVRNDLGVGLSDGGIAIGRLAGLGLLSLGLAYWPSSNYVAERTICALFTYNLLASLYLGYLRVGGGFVSYLLWPAIVLHAFLTLVLAPSIESVDVPPVERVANTGGQLRIPAGMRAYGSEILKGVSIYLNLSNIGSRGKGANRGSRGPVQNRGVQHQSQLFVPASTFCFSLRANNFSFKQQIRIGTQGNTTTGTPFVHGHAFGPCSLTTAFHFVLWTRD